MNVHSVILLIENMTNTANAAARDEGDANKGNTGFIVTKAAVLGAGTMGAGIAAHLANAGIPTLLLDIAPEGGDPADKNAIVRSLFEASKKLRPAPYMLADNTR